MAFKLAADEQGHPTKCLISGQCDATKSDYYGWSKGGWHTWRSLKPGDLTSAPTKESGGEVQVVRKRRKKKKAQ